MSARLFVCLLCLDDVWASRRLDDEIKAVFV